tara:strand:- start:953 stop:2290 length:1338 start_codon:yes stop_codon:yes gene_type:complete
MDKFNRRDFIKGLGIGSMLASNSELAIANMLPMSGSFSDFKALVCIFLFGGNDSFNMVVPTSNAEYNIYKSSRQNMAIDKSELLSINPLNPDGSQYGLHPSMNNLQSLFESGAASFIANVGPLIEPTTKNQYRNSSTKLPPQLFSHNDQQNQWQTLRGRDMLSTGWAGRAADLLKDNVTNQAMAINLSLRSKPIFQVGNTTVPYVMGSNGPLDIFKTSDQQKLAFEEILDIAKSNLYEKAFIDVQKSTVLNIDAISTALNNAPTLSTNFPDSGLGKQLKTVAKLIGSRNDLGMSRQIFFVATGGFDSHSNQLTSQPALLSNVSDCISSFYNATVELGVSNSVTSFTQSDFGRTLSSNGNGTDHAWGSVQVISGGAIDGRKIFGTYPTLEIRGPDDASDGGRMIPTTSSDQYAATLARWLGVTDNDLIKIAPSINNFSVTDLGLLV